MSIAEQNMHEQLVTDFMWDLTQLSEKYGLHLSGSTTMKLRDNNDNKIKALYINWRNGDYEWETL